MRTDEQMASIVTRATKDLHHDLARKWSIPVGVLSGATFGLGVTMMYEMGCSEEQIIEAVRCLVGNLAASPDERGAS